jgi:anti-sigma factor RsiW
MSCEQVRPALSGYHFDTLDPNERAHVEAHLPGCPHCVAEYIAIKRAIETASHVPAPSERARLRLRQAMASALSRRAPAVWWERPLAVSVAAASVLLALGVVQAISQAPGAAPWAARATQGPGANPR